MTVSELAALLQTKPFDPNFYELDGSDPRVGGYNLEKTVDGWHVNYFERGHKSTIARFSSESDACEFLFKKLRAMFGLGG